AGRAPPAGDGTSVDIGGYAARPRHLPQRRGQQVPDLLLGEADDREDVAARVAQFQRQRGVVDVAAAVGYGEPRAVLGVVVRPGAADGDVHDGRVGCNYVGRHEPVPEAVEHEVAFQERVVVL